MDFCIPLTFAISFGLIGLLVTLGCSGVHKFSSRRLSKPIYALCLWDGALQLTSVGQIVLSKYLESERLDLFLATLGKVAAYGSAWQLVAITAQRWAVL